MKQYLKVPLRVISEYVNLTLVLDTFIHFLFPKFDKKRRDINYLFTDLGKSNVIQSDVGLHLYVH